MDAANQALYDRHLQSWDAFMASLPEPLRPLTAEVDKNGFSLAVLNNTMSNNLYDKPVLRSNQKFTNVTSICGSGYLLIGSQRGCRTTTTAVTMLPTASEVAVFFFRLALLFAETRALGRQFIAPLQLNLTLTSDDRSCSINSKYLFPHTDLDDDVLVSHSVLEKALIDEDGFVKEDALKALHFSKEQLAHRAMVAAGVVAKMLGIPPGDLFVVVMRSPIPGITFVRSIDHKNAKYGFRFTPKCENISEKALVKLKPSYWLVFGLRRFLELTVDKFKDLRTDTPPTDNSKTYNDDLRKTATYVNSARMMRRDESDYVENRVEEKNFVRGYGIVMHTRALQMLRELIAKALREDCRKGGDSWRLPHGITVTAERIKVDNGVSGMRPVRASKKFQCAYHELFYPMSRIRQNPVPGPTDCPCGRMPRGQCSRLCVTGQLRSETPTAAERTEATKCPFPTGVHVNETEGIDPKDKWLLTARCNEVILVADGLGHEIPWAMKLLEHETYGPLFEVSLTNLFMPVNIGRRDDPDEYPAPGIVVMPDEKAAKADERTVRIFSYPIHGDEDVVMEPAPVPPPEDTSLNRFVPSSTFEWEADATKADWKTSPGARVVATEALEKATDREALATAVTSQLRELILKSRKFNQKDFATGAPVTFPASQDFRVFVTKHGASTPGIVACIGPPFFCSVAPSTVSHALSEYYADTTGSYKQDTCEFGIKSYFHHPDCEAEVAAITKDYIKKPATKGTKDGAEAGGAKRCRRVPVILGNNFIVRYNKTNKCFEYNFSCSNPKCRNAPNNPSMPMSCGPKHAAFRAILGLERTHSSNHRLPWDD